MDNPTTNNPTNGVRPCSSRMHGREAATATTSDRIERAGDAFHTRLREGFLKMAAEEPSRIVRIDASGTPDEVWSEVWKSLAPLI